MSHATKDDQFLAQILEAEAKATNSIDKAKAKAKSDADAYNQKLADVRATKLDAQRDKAKDSLKDRQTKARKMYEDMVAEGEREANMFAKETDRQIEKQITLAQAYFINDLLA